MKRGAGWALASSTARDTAANILGAFINEVEAQRGQKISEANATVLTEFAMNARENL